jgi:hypothetical protein
LERNNKKKFLAVLPLVFCIWCNLHGGWVLGLITLGVYSVGSFFHNRQKAVFTGIVTFFCLLASLVNPWGFAYWAYLFHALTMSRVHITEWRAVSPISPVGIVLTLTLLLVLRGRGEWQHRFPEFALFLFSLFTAFSHLRLVGFYFLVLSIFMAQDLIRGVTNTGKVFSRHKTKIASALMLVTHSALGAGVIFFLYQIPSGFRGLDYSYYPKPAVEWLWSSGYKGKLLLGFNHGSYALWRLFPRFRISVDGRFEEVYESGIVDRNRCALSSACKDQKHAMEEIRPDLILSTKKQFALPKGASYEKVYEDDTYEVFRAPGLKPTEEPGKITDTLQADAVLGDIWKPRFNAQDLFTAE